VLARSRAMIRLIRSVTTANPASIAVWPEAAIARSTNGFGLDPGCCTDL
jgi:hypothetical protein